MTERYKALAEGMDERNLEKILSFKTADFHAIGPEVLDHISMKEYSRQFITNNIPPYNTKNTILNLRLSDNRLWPLWMCCRNQLEKESCLEK